MHYLKLFTAAAVALLLSASCIKDKKIDPVVAPQPVDQQKAAVAFDFTAKANNKALIADSAWYSNAAGDSFTITKFNYYITNIKLVREDGFVFAEPESYRINRHADGPCKFTVNNLPDGTYNYIEFLVGVDSVRNSSGAQTGALDVNQGMYWDWNTGYVFFKLEGNFKTQISPVPNEFAMHVGTTPYIKKCTFHLGVNTISASKGKQSTVHYNVNIDEIFNNPVKLDFDTYHAVSGGRQAGTIAENYKDMFSITLVEN